MTHESYPDLPTAGAAAIVFDGLERVLLVKENYGLHRWSLPGGAIEANETPEEAVVREAFEETGAIVEIDHLVGEYLLDDDFTVFAFACRIASGIPRVPTTGEIAAVEWHARRYLPLPRSNVLHYAVPDAIAGHRDLFRQVPRVNN